MKFDNKGLVAFVFEVIANALGGILGGILGDFISSHAIDLYSMSAFLLWGIVCYLTLSLSNKDR
jgi:hypothetical protein